MLSKKVIPISLLLTGNALIVVILIVVSNQWWWDKLAYLDSKVTSAEQASEQSQGTLLELVNSRLPLNKLLATSSLNIYRFISEIELLVLDSSRDYESIKQRQQQFKNVLVAIERAWPKSMPSHTLETYKINIEIVIDIIDEVIETTSPIQLEYLVDELEETLPDLLEVMNSVEEQNNKLFLLSTNKVLSNSTASKKHVAELKQTSADIIQQSIFFILFGGLFILFLQLGLYFILQQRLSGLLRVMKQITQGASLEQRVTTTNSKDLIANIARAFNLMLDRLQQTHMQLGEQIERAESATQAKSDFLANMSHEIRTPVHAITGIIHLMKEQTLTPKIQDYTDKVQTASEALMHVINDVLDFSKITAGKIELENKPFELLATLEKHVDLFSEKINSKHLDFVLVIDKNVPRRVIGDDLRLNQILINIINNALKFTHSGTVQLRVSCDELSSDQAILTFVVEDTGIGIDSQRLPLLFTEFSQGDVSTTRKYGGTGLGLTISQKLSQLMAGDITVTSQLEKGSAFSVRITLGVDSNQDQKIFPVLPVKDNAKNILYIGAKSKQSEMFAGLLEQIGLHFIHTQSLEHAQTLLLADPLHSVCSLIFIDAPPQQQTTIELLIEKVANYSQLLKHPIIYISATQAKENTVTEIQVIDRPIKPSQLFNTLITTLNLPTQPLLSHNNSDLKQSEKRQEIQNRICGAKILAVEDVMINQQIIREILNSGGLHVQLANNGREALDILEKDNFDLVLMDLQMPVMGGIEATSLIRQQAKFKKLPVIAITANVMKGVIDECKQIGFSDYLSKPLDVQLLWEMLDVWIAPAQRSPLTTEQPPLPVQVTKKMNIQQDKFLGIDLSAGLNCVNGNTALYCTLLGDFIREYESSPARFNTYYDKKDYDNLAQLAHAIKGVSSNLGLSLLAKASYCLEKQAKRIMANDDINLISETEIFADLSSSFSDALTQANNSIAHIIATYVPSPSSDQDNPITAQDIDFTALMLSLSNLNNLIDISDGDSLQAFDDIKNTLSALADRSDLALLEEHINCFNFEDASITLLSIEQQITDRSSDITNP